MREDISVPSKISPVVTTAESYDHTGAGMLALRRLETAEGYNRWIASLVGPYLGRWNLEIGAGRGTIAEIIASERKLDVLDPANANWQYLCALQNNKTNIGKVFSLPSDIPHSYRYDCIYSSNVLEHVYDDKGELEKYLRLLPSGGRIVAVVPAGGKILYSRFDRLVGHYRRYSLSDRRRLRYLTDADGRRAIVRQYSYLNPIGALGWFVMMKLGAQTDISQSAIRRSQQFLPLSRLLNATQIPFGQSLLIVWKKK